MGPCIFTRTSKKTDIKYSVRILPIGGYVSMDGEDEDIKDNPRALCNKPLYQRFIITAAGSVMNILLGVILTFVTVMASQSIGSVQIADFAENAVSHNYGLEQRDIIEKIGNTRVHTANDISYTIVHDVLEAVDITVNRNGKETVIRDVRFGRETEECIDYGVMDFYLYSESKTIGNVIKHSFFDSVLSVRMIWESIFDLFSGKYSLDSVSGPVGITSTVSSVAKKSTVNLLYLCSVIAMNLGIFNLLPIPALDGGRILFQLIELVFGKPINRKAEGYIHTVGIIILFGFMILITFKDIIKLIG